MKMSVARAPGRDSVAVLRLEGELDASNFEALIAHGQQLYEGGVRHVLLDMSGVGYMGSSGLVALHSLVLILAGGRPPDPEAGWSAHHSIGPPAEGGSQNGLKILAPQPTVLRALERTGMSRFIAIHTDEEAALASF